MPEVTLSTYSETAAQTSLPETSKASTEPFSVQTALKEPMKQFACWYKIAESNSKVNEPSAMCLATSSL